MRRAICVALLGFAVGCGNHGNSFNPDGGDDMNDCDPLTGCPDPGLDEAGEGAAPCDGLECQIINCGTPSGTTISGTVYDPAQQRGLYNVFVYIPNRPLDPIADGPVCTQCQAPASGKPIKGATATTDFKGHFTIQNAPVGQSIPLVMQLGKWRRKIILPQVDQCVDNPLTNKAQTRLPKKEAEGGEKDNHIPKIAFTTGCDWAECFLERTVGIDPSEFTGPTGSGRVQVYKGQYTVDMTYSVAIGDAYQFWGSLATMKKYDIVFDACECSPFDRTKGGQFPNAYANMKGYLEGGGRMFGTHYHYNWFAAPTGPADFQMQAPWLSGGFGAPPFNIDDSTPRGKAFAQWLQFWMVTPTYGQIDVADTRNSVGGLNGGMKGNGIYKNTTQWIYHPSNQTLYLSFNAPTKNAPMMQCGRAVFSDVHLSGGGFGARDFPNACSTLTGHDKNEQALEFLFFDLSSCVQDDSMNPIQPPPN